MFRRRVLLCDKALCEDRDLLLLGKGVLPFTDGFQLCVGSLQQVDIMLDGEALTFAGIPGRLDDLFRCGASSVDSGFSFPSRLES